MKRIVALLLAMVMLLPGTGVFAAEQPEQSEEISQAAYDAVTADVWESIVEIEEQKIVAKRGKDAGAEAYAAIVDDVIAAVERSDTYIDGSINRNGDFFTWETTEGVVCGYSPRLRAQICQGTSSTVTEAEIEVFSATKTATNASTSSAFDVSVFQPYYGIDKDFTTQYQTEGKAIAEATGGSCTVYKTTSATIDNIADALESSAVVIFDSHGDTDYYTSSGDSTSMANTSYLCLQSGEGLTAADQAQVTGPFGTYYHAYFAGYDMNNRDMKYYCVDGTAIANHMDQNAQNGLLWMAICLGMATEGIQKPLRDKGVGVVYGYSQSVTFDGDYCFEKEFWSQMRARATVASAIAAMKNKYGCWDLSRQMYTANGWTEDAYLCANITQAQKNYAAFPIVASAEDAYPGHGNVDALQTVNSTWRLPMNGSGHQPVSVPAAASTCTKQGNIACWFCAHCNKYYRDEACTEEISQTDMLLPLAAHSSVTDPAVPATCMAEGKTEGSHCSVCNAVLVAQTTVPKSEHTAVTDLAIPATCMAEGKTEGEHCAVCGKVLIPQKELSALGHQFGAWETTERPTCSKTGVQKHTCIRCGQTEEITLAVEACKSEGFTDVPKNVWYHAAVDFVVGQGIMNGVSDDSFAPDGRLTRAMLATILYRINGDIASHTHPFTDVSDGRYYSAAVAWAYETGVVTGTSATTFAPDAYITREQAATMLYRYAARYSDKTPEATGDLSVFGDANQASAYAQTALRWAVGEGILNGKGNGVLDPGGTATRAELAKILLSWLN